MHAPTTKAAPKKQEDKRENIILQKNSIKLPIVSQKTHSEFSFKPNLNNICENTKSLNLFSGGLSNPLSLFNGLKNNKSAFNRPSQNTGRTQKVVI